MFEMLELIKWTVLLAGLSVMALIDWKKQKIYLLMVIVIGCVGLGIHIFLMDMTIADIFFGVLLGVIMLLLGYFTEEHIGYGDGFTFIMTGIYLGGRKNLTLLVISSVLAGFYALILLIIRKKNRQDRIAYIPFVLLGYIILMI